MPLIKIDRNWFGRLTDRYYTLEVEHRVLLAMLDHVKTQNPAIANQLDVLQEITTDSVRNEWIEEHSQLGSAWAVEDDDAFLRVLAQFLSRRLGGQ
jgi:hypothetical protein